MKTIQVYDPPMCCLTGICGTEIDPALVSFAALLTQSGSCDPLLQCREESEHRYLREVVEKQSTRTAWLPWQPQEPIGPDALAQLASATLPTSAL